MKCSEKVTEIARPVSGNNPPGLAGTEAKTWGTIFIGPTDKSSAVNQLWGIEIPLCRPGQSTVGRVRPIDI